MKKRKDWGNDSLINNFDLLFEKFRDSVIVLSYGDPGNPTINEIQELLFQYKRRVKTFKANYKYRLNHSNGNGLSEVLMIGM